MSNLNQSQYEQIVNNLNEFITSLKNSGYNISTTHYVSTHHLINTLAAQQQLPSEANQLSQLLMPLLCCCEKEQLDFPHQFFLWIQSLQPDTSQSSQTINDEIKKTITQNKTIKKQFIVLVLVLLFELFGFVFQDVIQNQIQIQLAKYFPIPDFEQVIELATSKDDIQKNVIKPPLAVIPETIETEAKVQRAQVKPTINRQFKKYGEFVGFALAMLLTLMVCWWGWLYLQTHRFLTRHKVLSPTQLRTFFLNKPRPLFTLLNFTFTAQQLHKHQRIASNYLDPQATIKQTVAKSGLFTACYQPLLVVPEYLVLISCSCFKDQLSVSVRDFIYQLEAMGLFVECFYFNLSSG